MIACHGGNRDAHCLQMQDWPRLAASRLMAGGSVVSRHQQCAAMLPVLATSQ
jgi:hypothetical protein